MLCSDCKKEPSEGWLDGEGGELCQMCWEKQCDKEWWEYVKAWNEELLAGIT